MLYVQVILTKCQLPLNVMLICIRPMFAPILAGSFSRENALYGATISVEATCHPDPKRVTEKEIHC